ncbi:hypothetical protein Taro_019361 [Colocasia esculenta]|uniref:Uncharacterized protein n=1 Tax=Colocasia esculenta TaxID=4460 RepID=A0A843V579_COLES|nr:hypothetical protein [Colocasia esculenta]
MVLVCSVLGEFPTEPVTSEAHPYPHRLRPVRGRQSRIKYVIGLTGLAEVFRHSWYQSKKFEMTDRRDWGGGGDDPEESTQRMIERIWESHTDIRARMDQQALVLPVAVPPGNGETVPVAPVPQRVEVPFVAPVPPPPPVLLAEEPVMQAKEEDGEVVSNFNKAEVGLRWRSCSKVLPGSPLLHQDIDVIIAISRGI